MNKIISLRQQIQEARALALRDDEIIDAEVTEISTRYIGRHQNEILEIMSRIDPATGHEEPPPYTGKWHNIGQQYNVDPETLELLDKNGVPLGKDIYGNEVEHLPSRGDDPQLTDSKAKKLPPPKSRGLLSKLFGGKTYTEVFNCEDE